MLRSAAAALARAAGTRASLATSLADVDARGLAPAAAAQAVAEGFVLGTYRFSAFKSEAAQARPEPRGAHRRGRRTGPPSPPAARAGVAVGEAVALARDLANTPPDHLNAADLAERAIAIAAERKLGIEVLDESDMAEMGLGGMLGVNRGSDRPAPHRSS